MYAPETCSHHYGLDEAIRLSAKDRRSFQPTTDIQGGVAAPLPKVWRPQLAVQASTSPKGEAWIHEVKHDGHRGVAIVQRGQVRFLTRNGHDWTSRYGMLARAFDGLDCDTAILDGEIAVEDGQGVTSLHNLQSALADGRTHTLTFFAFDLPYLNGQDLRAARLVDRKAALEGLIARSAPATSQLRFSDHCERDGAALFARANRLGMEGIVSKRAASPYVHARSRDWVKVKRTDTGRFVIIGFLSNGPGSASSLILAEEREGTLVYACRAGAGLTAADTLALYVILSKSECEQPLVSAPRTPGARWVAPSWTVLVGFHGRTGLGKPRAPVLLRIAESVHAAGSPPNVRSFVRVITRRI